MLRPTSRSWVPLISLLLLRTAPSAAQPVSAEDYERKLLQLDREAGPIVAKVSLLAYPPFVDLAADGDRNTDAVISFLSGGRHTHQQRMIAILSMHNLGPLEYVQFLRKMLKLLDKGDITIYEESLAFLPTYEFSTTLIVNYKDRAVRNLLLDVLSRPDTDRNLRLAIEDDLSGKALQDMKDFQENCCTDYHKK